MPIVNENDTVATDEIRFGDNDRLAAQIAVTVGADRLVLLVGRRRASTTPTRFLNPDAHRFETVDEITPEIEAMAGEGVSGLSKGGMRTKLMAAKTATAGGCAMAITLGSRHRPLQSIIDGATHHLVHAAGRPGRPRERRWIAAMKPRGEIIVDAGAVRALHSGNSLLPAGVTRSTACSAAATRWRSRPPTAPASAWA